MQEEEILQMNKYSEDTSRIQTDTILQLVSYMLVTYSQSLHIMDAVLWKLIQRHVLVAESRFI